MCVGGGGRGASWWRRWVGSTHSLGSFAQGRDMLFITARGQLRPIAGDLGPWPQPLSARSASHPNSYREPRRPLPAVG